jgi:hypothetical protein
MTVHPQALWLLDSRILAETVPPGLKKAGYVRRLDGW